MSTAELKNQIIKSILDVEDITLLQQLKAIINGNNDWAEAISKEEKSGIEKGITDFRNGDTFSHESVRTEVNRLLNKE